MHIKYIETVRVDHGSVELEHKVAKHLQALGHDREAEFDHARKLVYEPATEPFNADAAGNALRYVLSHWKGELWERVRDRRKQKFNWEDMALRLIKLPPSDYRAVVLIQQKHVHDDLHKALTGLSKRENSVSKFDLEVLFRRLVDHIGLFAGYPLPDSTETS